MGFTFVLHIHVAFHEEFAVIFFDYVCFSETDHIQVPVVVIQGIGLEGMYKALPKYMGQHTHTRARARARTHTRTNKQLRVFSGI